MEKCEKNKGINGITLIALVITIIVLLILAGISITMISGNNSILARATEAKEELRGAAVEEHRNLWVTNISLANQINENTIETLDDLLERIGPEGENLLTDEEIDTIKNTKKLTIGKRTINFDVNEFIKNDSKYQTIFRSGDVAYVLKDGKELYRMYKQVDESGYYLFNIDEAEKVLDNVKKYNGQLVITNDNLLYKMTDYVHFIYDSVKDFLNPEISTGSYVIGTDGNIYNTSNLNLVAYDAKNVTKLGSRYYLKSDNKLYVTSADGTLVAENVKDFDEGVVYDSILTTDNKVYTFSRNNVTTKNLLHNNVKSWYKGIYYLKFDNKIYNNVEAVAENVKELYNNGYYTTLDNRLYDVYHREQLITDKFKEWYNESDSLFVTTDNMLYRITQDIPIINVNDIKSLYYIRGNAYNYLITKDNKLIEISSPSTVIAENVKEIFDSKHFVDIENNLYDIDDPTEVIAENVKSFNNNSYTDFENELYIYFEVASHDNEPM